MYRASFKFAGLLVALALTACGGGSGSDASAVPPAPGTPAVPEQPTTPNVPATPTPVTADRIEPLDTGLPKLASSASAKAAVRSGVAVQATPLRLGPLEGVQALVRKATQPAALTKGAPQQIGVARPVEATAKARDLMGQLKWQLADAGLQRAAVSFTAVGAQGVRLGLVVRQLPPGTVLRFYSQAGSELVQVLGTDVLRSIQRNLDAGDTGDSARTYWGPDFGGAETTLELEVPVGARLEQELDIAVPTLSHIFVSPDQATAASFAKLGESGSCNIDVSCKPELSAESRSVARMIFVVEGDSYLCTGTLLNDAASSKVPHFLSAHHCISTQTVASSLTTDWFYRSSSCNNATLNPGTQKVTGGAQLLFADSQTDTSFLRLNSAPPQGVVYAGSYVGSVNTSAAVLGIHHPRGDLQKASAGSVVQFSYCSNEQCFPQTQQDGRFYTVGWTEGTTEGGSSGSGLFFSIGSTRYLIGQLYGGSSSCAAPTGRDYYGRFDLPFNLALKSWLMPGS
ncbi:MAG: endoproteinase ArgC [Gammaproteobacteria bacterium]|nr:endoproteinase ArgC [Gammaproteobacteria bacterium]MBU1507092.1 endoproteinase ArgC [Gammaproteobacteria bacterium]MBU2121706.1 endoproteinase ArgC [Gammaproteobacteria bacterium]MBU2172725.1 endoproteinase ArgC [Gammaproteobacteria bacterium]MBU2200771.1 endoproteinase ArgC [Gammaproteobacteria bacterium]